MSFIPWKTQASARVSAVDQGLEILGGRTSLWLHRCRDEGKCVVA